MVRADTIHLVKALSGRLVAQAGAVAAMIACTYLGYQLHAISSETSIVAHVVDSFHAVIGAVVSFFDMDPIAAAVIFPAMIVAMLLLGGLYLWRQQPD